MNTRSTVQFLRFALGFVLLCSLVMGEASQVSAAALQCYVKWNASGASTGASWGDAYTDLQSALGGSLCTEIWVAKGTYKPTASTDRTISFLLKSGVSIYGGFAGTETLRSERDPVANLTILSGEIGDPGTTSDNSYHVVVGSGTDSTALLDGFTITAGKAHAKSLPDDVGGGIYNDNGSPNLRNMTVSGNSAFNGGGMGNVYNSSPNLVNVTFSRNSATYGGGMINFNSSPSLANVAFSDNSADLNGGGMYNSYSSPSLANVTFSGNSATYSGGGGMFNYNNSNPSLTDVSFSGNSAAEGCGGGMLNEDRSSPSLANVAFSDNSAMWGGGMYNQDGSNPSLANVTFSANSATKGIGGGMYNDASSPSLRNMTFSSNTADSGGGMGNGYNSSPILVNVIFSGNSATAGGGMDNSVSSPSLKNVTFSGNLAIYGGGMVNYNSSPSLTNVTFSGNSATSGGGMYNQDGSSPRLTNVTISGNSADWGDGGMINVDSSPTITNSILYGDTVEIVNYGGSPTVNYSIVQGGYPGMGNLDADPLLGLLQDNGGFTQTMALGSGSPAIDKGSNAGCPTKDQRGIARPQGPRCDMGAYELKQFQSIAYSTGSQDGWVLESTETSEEGGTSNATPGTIILGDNAADRQYLGILSFKTAGLPDNAVITSAKIKIMKAGLTGTDPFTTHGNILVDVRKGPFSGNTALQIIDFQAAASKLAAITIKNTPAGGWYSGAMGAANYTYINKTGFTQFRLRFGKDDNDDLSADYLKFFSGDFATTTSRPKLIITYYAP